MKKIHYETDLCVVGGGMAGICTALSAARHGIKVVLLQDRPVLGGNASSEIRMWIGGARGDNVRETGILEEIVLENFYTNPGLKFPLWDMTLFSVVKGNPNITLLLNSSVLDAECENNRIKSVTAWQSNAETFHIVSAKYFADCSGDSILAPLTGAEYRYGRESKKDFDETVPPEVSDGKTMGMSCLLQIRETDHPVKFIKPDWAYTYETDDDLPGKNHELHNNFWWIEVGGEWDCIHDSDRCRDECLKIAYGVWDHMKNREDHGIDNWELEWIGMLPGKRESRRYIGEHTVTQKEIEAGGKYKDTVAFGGWPMDNHPPAGFYYHGEPSICYPVPSPWGLPLRCMISKNIKNLTFAGRNISITHAGLSSSRVMGTCAVLGQGLGTALAQAINEEKDIREIDVEVLKQSLLQDDCLIPGETRKVSNLCKNAICNAPVVLNGIERGDENLWIGKKGDFIEYQFDKEIRINSIRLVFDSFLNRKYYNMPCRFLIDEKDFHIPETLIKSYKIIGFNDSEKEFVLSVENNHQRFVTTTVDWNISRIRFIPIETYKDESFKVFNFEVN